MALDHIKKIIPDSIFQRMQYKKKLGKRLNLRNPVSFNEKIQWLKLHDRNPKYINMVDKLLAKEYVSKLLGDKYIIPTIGVWDSFDDIDFDKLPDQFVLKCNHDSGGLIIVRNKKDLDLCAARIKINNCLKRNYYYVTREWPYKNVKPLVFAEELINGGEKGLVDYKFFNFNSKSEFLYISEGLENHATASISFFDFKGRQLPFKRNDYRPFEGDYSLPENFDEMHRVSDELAKDINSAFVRTDFYSIGEKVQFSEITFSPCGGLIPFDPPEWDERLGNMIDLRGLQ